MTQCRHLRLPQPWRSSPDWWPSRAISRGRLARRPIKIVTPLAAGGATDMLARAVGEELFADSRQPVVIENRPGGAGTLAADRWRAPTRRLHAVARHRRRARHPPRSCQEGHLRSDQGFHAADHGGRAADLPGGAQGAAGQRRSASSSPTPRPIPASCRSAARGRTRPIILPANSSSPGGNRHGPCALSRRQSRHDRSAGRADSGAVRHAVDRGAALESGKLKVLGMSRPNARAAPPRSRRSAKACRAMRCRRASSASSRRPAFPSR